MNRSSNFKICIVTDAWTPVWGGGQEHIWQTATRLAQKHGCKVDLLVPNIKNNETSLPKEESYCDGKLRLFRLGPGFKFPEIVGRLFFLISVLSWQLTHNYDICHSQASDAVLLPIVKIVKRHSKYVYTVHGSGVALLNGGILNTLKIPQKIADFLIYKYPFDALLTVAASTIKNRSAAKYFSIIGNGVDVASFDKVPERRNRDVFKIIWVGRPNDPVKGIKYLEEAYKLLSNKYKNIVLNLVTNKFGNDKIKEFKSADLFVLPSLSEGLPLVLLEAMAARLPIVTTDVGDCGSLINQFKNGLVVSPARSDLLSSAIEEVYTMKNRELVGNRGHDAVVKNYNWDMVTDKIYKCYEKISEK